MGTLVFHGEGGSSAQAAIDTTAAGDIWDNDQTMMLLKLLKVQTT